MSTHGEGADNWNDDDMDSSTLCSLQTNRTSETARHDRTVWSDDGQGDSDYETDVLDPSDPFGPPDIPPKNHSGIGAALVQRTPPPTRLTHPLYIWSAPMLVRLKQIQTRSHWEKVDTLFNEFDNNAHQWYWRKGQEVVHANQLINQGKTLMPVLHMVEWMRLTNSF